MKKTKLFMPILGITTIASALVPAFTSCSCSTKYNTVTLLEESKANRVVGTKASDILFRFKQENLKEHESTKVKLTNLKVNGAEVASVAGLLKYQVDSAGNIVVDFNIATAKEHYSATSVSFDLVFTNKKANTEYTLTGFSIAYEESGEEELKRDDWWDIYAIYYNNFSKAPLYSGANCKNSFITIDGKTTTIDHSTITYDNEKINVEENRARHTLFDDKGKEIENVAKLSCIGVFRNFGGNVHPEILKLKLEQTMIDRGLTASYTINGKYLQLIFTGKVEEKNLYDIIIWNEYSYVVESRVIHEGISESQVIIDKFIERT